jgi:hypothetical protein
MAFDVERSRLFVVLSFEFIVGRCVGPVLKPCTICVERGVEMLRMPLRQQLGASRARKGQTEEMGLRKRVAWGLIDFQCLLGCCCVVLVDNAIDWR